MKEILNKVSMIFGIICLITSTFFIIKLINLLICDYISFINIAAVIIISAAICSLLIIIKNKITEKIT